MLGMARGLCRTAGAVALGLAVLVSPARGQSPPDPQVLGQVPADFEVHGDLILVSGQLSGFAASCGFGQMPDPEELYTYYEYYNLARNPSRLRTLYAMGEDLGRTAPCTAAHQAALVRHWDQLMARVQAYVKDYR